MKGSESTPSRSQCRKATSSSPTSPTRAAYPPASTSRASACARMAVARPHEDPVALAANAARRAVRARRSIDPATHRPAASSAPRPRSITRKPVAAVPARPARAAAALPRLRGQARLLRRHRRACSPRVDWIASGSARGRSALVVCTDIARYGAATARRADAGRRRRRDDHLARIRASLALEVGVTGSYAQDVNDFWRPLYQQGGAWSTGTTRCSATSTRSPAPTRAGRRRRARRATATSSRAAATTCRTARWRRRRTAT